MKSDPFTNWPITKKYKAAHYFLSNAKPITVTDNHRTRLSAIHLQLTYGNHVAGLGFDDQKVNLIEKRKREEEWKTLKDIPKANLIRKFTETVNEIQPNWMMYKPLYDDFEQEWQKSRTSQTPRSMTVGRMGGRSPRRQHVEHIGTPTSKWSSPRDHKQNMVDIPKKPAIYNLSQRARSQKKKPFSLQIQTSVTSFGPQSLTDQATPCTNYIRPIRQSFTELKSAGMASASSMPQTITSRPPTGSRPATTKNNRITRHISIDFDEGIQMAVGKMENQLQEHSSNFGNNLQEYIDKSFNEMNTNLMVNIIRPQFDILSVALAELEEIFDQRYDHWGTAIRRIRETNSDNLQLMFSYLEALAIDRDSNFRQNTRNAELRENLVEALANIKELHDPVNTECKSFGTTKLKREVYRAGVESAKQYFKDNPCDEWKMVVPIEKVMDEQTRRLRQLDIEMQQIRKQQDEFIEKFKESQQFTAKTHIELSNMYKDMKKSLGSAKGPDFETRLNSLEKENITLKLERMNSLGSESRSPSRSPSPSPNRRSTVPRKSPFKRSITTEAPVLDLCLT